LFSLLCYNFVLTADFIEHQMGRGEDDNESIVTNGEESVELVINYYIMMNVPEQYHKILSLWP